MTYIQHMRQDRMECEIDEIKEQIKQKCSYAESLLEDIPACDVEESDDIQFNVNVLQKIIKSLNDIKAEIEELETLLPSSGIEEYDRIGNR